MLYLLRCDLCCWKEDGQSHGGDGDDLHFVFGKDDVESW